MSKSKRKMTGKRDTRPTIALLTDQVVYEYQSEIVTGVIEAARERDVNLLCFIGGRLGVTDGFESQGNAIYDLVRAESVDGVVVMASALSSQVGFEEIKSLCESFHPLPMVSVGLMLEGVTSLVVDNKTGLHEVLVHLIKDHGCRRIAFIRGPQASAEAVLRYHTYLNVLKEFDLPFDPDLVVPGDFLRPSGVAAVSLLLDERGVDFDAIVAANDGMALGALETLQARGIRVPDDIAVVGFDDVEETEFVTPPLTTVRQALYKQGQQATEMVLALMAGEKVPEQVTLSTEMVIRQSCGCLPAVVLEVKSEQVAKQKRQAIESAVQAHRDSILSGMMQAAAISSVELTSEQAEQLLTAFAGELSGKASGVFLPTLNSIINRAVAAGSDVGAWQTVLSALRLLSSHLDEDSLSQAESLWLRARVLIGETARRVQGHRALQEAVRNRTLWQVGAALITTLDLEHSMDVLADGLPHVGIPSAYLSLYQDPQPYAYPQPVPEWSRLVLTYEKMGDSVGSKQVKLSVEGQRFPTHRLVPKELLPQDRQYCLVVRPLFLHESQIGFVLFEAGSQELATCEMLSTLISSALYGALLAQQTRDYAVRVQTAAEVSQAASSILDPIELIQQVVELVQERFALYYAGLFMVEEADSTGDSGGKWAVLQAGTGEAGRQMLARGHRLEIGGGSMIGWCVANKQARIALDVGEDAVRFENPFLPETRSELALPLVSRGEAIGALTIQSTEESAFSEEDVAVLQTMADQLANAIANARLYSALTREQYLMKALMENVPDYIYFKDTKSRFIVTTAAHLKTFGLSDLAGLVGKSDFDFFSGEHAQQAYDDEQRIIETGEPILGVEERETWPDRPDTWVLTSKMPLRDDAGNIVGTFGISRDITQLKLAEMALERRALQLQTAAEVSHAVSSILDPDDLIRQVVNLVQERFNLYYAGLFLVDQVGEWAVLRAGTGEAGRQMLARGHRLEIGGGSMVGWCVANKQARVALDVGEDAVRFENPFLPETRSELALPLVSRGEAIGALTIQSTEESAFSEEDVAVLQTMADQLANAIANARLFEQTQIRAEEMAVLNDLSQALAAHLSVQAVLDEVYHGAARLLNATDFYVALYDPTRHEITFPLDTTQDELDVFSSISADQGLTGYVIRNHTSLLIEENLPERMAELGIETVGKPSMSWLGAPMIAGDEVLGMLGVQDFTTPRAYDEHSRELLVALANQAANALVNARLFEQTQTALAEVEATQRRYLERAWGDYAQAREVSGYEQSEVGVAPLDETLPEVQQAMRERRTIILDGDGDESVLVVPVVLRGQPLGALGFKVEGGARKWGVDDVVLVEGIGEQFALAAENIRLLDETQRRAARERLTRDITDKMRRAASIEDIVQTAVDELFGALRTSRAFARLGVTPAQDDGKDE